MAITLLIFGFFSKFLDEVERELAKLHFLNSNHVSKMIILKVTIKVDQGASTFWMHGPLRVK